MRIPLDNTCQDRAIEQRRFLWIIGPGQYLAGGAIYLLHTALVAVTHDPATTTGQDRVIMLRMLVRHCSHSSLNLNLIANTCDAGNFKEIMAQTITWLVCPFFGQ